MHKLGSILAFVFNKIFAFVLIILILAAVPTAGVISTFTDKESVKTILDEADVYNTVPDNLLDLVELDFDDDDQSEEEKKSETRDKSIRAALEENGLIDPDELIARIKLILDRDFLKTQVETIIDSVYGYIDGSSDDFTFELSLSERADVASNELREFVGGSLSKIEPCQPGEFVESDDVEILDISCLPPGVDLEAELNSLLDELTAEDGVLGEVYTQEDLDLSEVDLEAAKVAYSGASLFTSFFWFSFVGLSVMVVLTSKTIHRGFKVVGVINFVLAAILLLGFGAVSSGFDVSEIIVDNQDELTAAQVTAIENIASPLADEIISQIAGRTTTISMAILVVGIGSFGLGVLLTRHHVDHLHLHHLRDDDETKTIDQIYPEPTKGPSKPPEDNVAADEKPEPTTPTKQTKPKPKKPTKKVQ